MNAYELNFDIFAMTEPKNAQDCIAIAKEILAELERISAHFDNAIARCEEQSSASA